MAKGAPIHKLTQPNRPLVESAGVILVRLQEMFDWAPAMHDPKNVEELHNMRIAAKRLRYTMEVFAPCFGKEFAQKLKVAEEVQERIGAIHDCDVLIPLLCETLDKEARCERKAALRKGGGPPEYLAAEGLAALLAKKRAERDRLYREFVSWWDALPPEELFQSVTELVRAKSAPPDTGK